MTYRWGPRLRHCAAAAGLLSLVVVATGAAGAATRAGAAQPSAPTATPIKHLVVIFQENVSFDHYFATYPQALNPAGEPHFAALPGTPSVAGLTGALLTHNPNLANPQRLDRKDSTTCDQNHDYDPQQLAVNGGLMDRFVQETSGSATGGVTGADCKTPLPGHEHDQATNKLVMDYYDGNTVTALWNYAQHFTLLDNSFGTTFGPSTPGALHLVSGDTSGAIVPAGSTAVVTTTPPPGDPAGMSTTVAHAYVDVRDGTIIGDPDPAYDDCSSKENVGVHGTNVGNLLTAHHITWGWFEGGFTPSAVASSGKSTCGSSHLNSAGAKVADYSAHHEPFQYYASTANPHHLAPTSVAMIGHDDRANHQYDLSSFSTALSAGNLPAVTFLKAAKYQDGHPGYSGPLDEQPFIVSTINALEESPLWSSTAVIIAYDDSDGWYDHVMGPIVNQSTGLPIDGCGTTKAGTPNNMCGYGPRLPMLVISPFAKANYVDHQLTDQSSILRFVEDNWHLGRVGGASYDRLAGSLLDAFSWNTPSNAPLTLDPATGEAKS
jgi:phospholipase C